MHQKSNNKHIAKLKYLKIGDLPKDEDIVSDGVMDNEYESDNTKTVIDFANSPMVSHDNHSTIINTDETAEEAILTAKTTNFQQSKKFEKIVSNTHDQSNTSKSEAGVPGFLQRVFPQKEGEIAENISISTKPKLGDELKMLPFNSGKTESNPNSFSSIFNKDHQEVFGIQRVFRKSILFLLLHLIGFGLLSFVGLNIFTLPIIFSSIVIIFYTVVTNIFYIIVADRSYIWLSLAGQVVLLLITNAFVGQSFDKATLVFAVLITLFTYFAYSELEKVQLSSRLFSIAHITTESIRILLTVTLLVLSLGVFNKALSQGSENFVSEAFLDKSFVLNNIVIGKYKSLSLNRYLMKGKFYIEGGAVKSDLIKPENGASIVFSDFLAQNYRPSESILTEDRKNEILLACDKKVVKSCDSLVTQEKQNNLEIWRKEAYPNLPYTLDTELTPARFSQISKQFYINEVKKFNTNGSQAGSDISDTLSKWLIVPRNYIIPAFAALILFFLLTIIKPLMRLVVFWITFVTWKILIWVGFTKINIEKVEAEIVSI